MTYSVATRGCLGLLISGLLLISAAVPAAAAEGWKKLTDTAPKGANSLALVDVEALRGYVTRQKQRQRNPADLKQLDFLFSELPETLRRAAIVAWLDHASFEPLWEFATVEFQKGRLPSIQQLVDKEQGYEDVIQSQPVVWSPRGRYLMPFGTDKLAVLRPTDRPLLARWLRKSKTSQEELSSYLRKIIDRSGDRTGLLLAVDMADAVSQVRATDRASTLASVSAAGLRASSLGTLLSQVRGISLEVQANAALQGRLEIEFDISPKMLQQGGRDVVLEILSRRGMMLPEFKDWSFEIERDSIVMTGPLEAGSLGDLLSFLTNPQPSAAATETGPEPNPPANPTNPPSSNPPRYTSPAVSPNPAKSSKRYFDSVTQVVNQCRNMKGLTVADRGYWNDKVARKIDQLPMLNVDPMLLDYGSKTAQLLRDSGNTIRNANMAAATEKVPSYTGYVNYGNGYWGSGSWAINDNRAYNINVDQRARQAGMSQYFANLKVIEDMTASVRRAMTEKYQIEF